MVQRSACRCRPLSACHQGARPNADRHFRVKSDGPEITVAIRGAGLEGEPPAPADLCRQNARRGRCLGKDVVDIPCRERSEDRCTWRRRIVRAIAQLCDLSGIGKRRVEPPDRSGICRRRPAPLLNQARPELLGPPAPARAEPMVRGLSPGGESQERTSL